MHGGPNDEGMPAVPDGVRASDGDRERVVARLRLAAGDGLLDLTELEDRLSAVYAARTVEELAPLTADLPDRAPRSPRPSVLDDDGFRHHLTVYALVIGMLVGIWLLSGGGHFWPFYPAAGWGIGLGLHRERVRTAQRRRRAKARTRDRSPVDPAVDRPALSTGGAQSVEPAAPSRRFVVALFVDVVGSTQLNEALGDERWVAVRRAYRSLVEECVTRHGGWEANCSGDGVLARFDDPESAVRAAVELLRSLERRRAESGFAPSVRIGIHSGDAMDEDGDIIGTVVNLAARVTDAAEVDEILVTEHVADHLGAAFATSGRGLHTLKGVGRPRHLLAVQWR